MPRALTETSLNESGDHITGRLTLGMVWGGLSGAMIGTGISMTIGLFYSSAIGLIFSVILVLGALGAVFGQIMGSLLADDMTFSSRSQGATNAFYNAAPMADLNDHKILNEQKTKTVSNQEVMARINTMRSTSASLPPYRADAQVFELIVSAAHKADARAGMGFKSLS